MKFSDIMKFLEDYGIGGLLFLGITTIIIGFIKSDWFQGLISKFLDFYIEKMVRNKNKEIKGSVKEISRSDIDNHDIIKFIDFWLYSKVPTFKFSTDYRTVVFRKYLDIFLKGYKKNIKKFIESGEFKDMDDAKIWQTCLTLINDTIYDYESEMRRQGIPDVIIEKMKIKNNDTLSLTIDLINGVCNSSFYTSDDNLLKVYSILNILLSILDSTISNSETICNSINGQLRGLTFDGKTEP